MKRFKKMMCAALVAVMVVSTGAQAKDYDGSKAGRYADDHADKNSYNPEYPAFDSDCTNFTSQCIVAGGFPTIGLPLSEAVKCYRIFRRPSVYHSYAYFSYVWYQTIRDYVATTPWTVAGAASGDSFFGFWDYVKYKGASPRTYYFGNDSTYQQRLEELINLAEVGDIIQISHVSDSKTANHSYIVSRKEIERTVDPHPGKRHIYVCAHTSNRRNDDFELLVTKNRAKDGAAIKKTDTVYLWRVTAMNMNEMAKKKVYK